MIGSLRRRFLPEPHNFVPVYVVLGILALSAISGWLIDSRLPILLALGVFLLLGAYFLLRQPMYGLVLLILVSFFLNREMGTGTRVTLNGTFLLTFAMLGVWCFRKFVLERQLQLAPSPVNLPIIILGVGSIISILVGNSGLVLQAREAASLTAQLSGWLLLVLPIGLLLFVGNNVTELRWLKLLSLSFILAGAFYFVGVQIPVLNRIIFELYNGNSVGPIFRIWLVALSLGQAFWNKGLSKPVRLGLILLNLLVFYYAWMDRGWIVGWTTPLIVILMLIWLRNWRWGLLFTLAGFSYYIYRSSNLISQVWDTAQQYSTISRTWTWPIMWDLIKVNPITGLGPANYYFYTVLYPIAGWYVNFNSHNNYIDILAQYGFLGLISFGWLVFSIGRIGWQLRSSVTDGFSLGYIYGALAGLVATLVSGVMADWFLPFLYNIGISGYRSAVFAWLFLGGLLALYQIYRTPTRQES